MRLNLNNNLKKTHKEDKLFWKYQRGKGRLIKVFSRNNSLYFSRYTIYCAFKLYHRVTKWRPKETFRHQPLKNQWGENARQWNSALSALSHWNETVRQFWETKVMRCVLSTPQPQSLKALAFLFFFLKKNASFKKGAVSACYILFALRSL